MQIIINILAGIGALTVLSIAWVIVNITMDAHREKKKEKDKNGEGYPDPTFGGAWGNIRREEKQKEAERLAMISNLIPVMKQTAELAGFEVVGRITLRDKGTGKEYK